MGRAASCHCGLRGEVHHEIMAAHQFVHQTRIADVTANESETILWQTVERLPIPGIGELVQHRNG